MKKKKKSRKIKFRRAPGQCGHCGSLDTFNSWDADGTKYYECQSCHRLSKPA